MRNAILFFCLLLSVCACNRRSYPHELLVADSLCYEMPDSAVVMLQRMETEMTDKDEATRMYYYLLTIKAKDKAYIFHTSDSLMLSVLQYYQKKKDTQHLPEAYYYAGRVYSDLGDAPQALDYFQKAIEGSDYYQSSRIYSQMGRIFDLQRLYDKSLEMYLKSLEFDKLLNDTVGMIFSLGDIGAAYWNLNKADSVSKYFTESYKLANKLKNSHYITMMSNQLADFYNEIGEYELAMDYLHKNIGPTNILDQISTYAIAAKLYYENNKLDSAKYYYEVLLDIGTIHAKRTAHKKLSDIAMKHNQLRDATSHYQKYIILEDSIRRMNESETVLHLQSLYNYQLREKEINKLNTENYEKEKKLILVLGACCLICFLFGIYFLHNRKKKALLRLQLEQLKKEQYYRSAKFIAENNKKIAVLEEQLKNADKENWALRTRLKGQRDIIISTNQLAELEIRRRDEADSLIVYTPIYQLIERILKQQGKQKLLTDANWKELEEAINEIYPGFTQSLFRLYHMNVHEYRVSLLIKINIQPSHIAILTNHSNESITATRRRLYFKVHGKKGRPHDWDEFIRSLGTIK